MRPIRSIVVLVIACAGVALAALPPGAEEGLRDNAAEKIRIKVTKVEKTGEQPEGCLQLIYTATVSKVIASKSGLKVGQEITIHAYHWTVDYAGPSNPPLLMTGWIGKAFLNPDPNDNGSFKLAAYGLSFVK